MDQETREEFAKVHAKLGQHDEKFERIDAEFAKLHAKLGQHDEKFERIDEKFERIDGEFRMVHGSFNQVAKVLHEMRLMMEHQGQKLDLVYESSIGIAAKLERMEALDKKVGHHEVRIGALEALARKS